MTPQTALFVISEWWFVAMVAAAFAYLGVRHGLTIELFVLLGVAAGIVFADPLAERLESPINSVYQFVEPIVRERITPPEKLVKPAKPPKLITVQVHRQNLGSVVFVLLVLAGLLIGRRRSAKAKSPRWIAQVLAALVGAVNGYLVAYFLFPRHITSTKTVIEMPTAPITDLLRVQLTVPILITVLVLITFGVLGARQGKTKGK
jgi:hypothetical protein